MTKRIIYSLYIITILLSFEQKKGYCFFEISPVESCILVTIAGGMYLEPVIPDIRFQKSFSQDNQKKIILSWPVHFIEIQPVNDLFTTLFSEPQYISYNSQFNLLTGSRFYYKTDNDNLLIWEAGVNYQSEHFGFMSGVGYGLTNNNDNIGLILRVTKSHDEIRGDISIDYWPHKYFKSPY